jgi:murein DD-endopeptidase MepM/ murein hydrolase activator NlpD
MIQQMAAEFVNQMVPALIKANPAIKVFVQIRTDSSPAALAKLVNGLSGVHVSILTQRSDVQDAINVASAFFGGQQSTAGNQQPRLYGDRLPSKDGRWLLPVATLHLGSNERDHINRGSVQAWDLIAPSGSPVFPIADGVVKYAGCDNKGGYGCWLYIEHAGGIKTIMGHCTHGSITVKTGQSVKQWDVVCTVGMTGMTSFGPHTHLEIHKSGGGRYNVGDFWDASRMKYQRLGNAVSNEVPAQIGVVGGAMVTGQQQATVTTVTTSKGQQLLQALASLPAEQFALLVSIVLGSLMFTWWLSGTYVRVVILATVTTVIVGGCIALLFMPTQIQATQTSQPVAVGGDWEKSYEITQGREGWKCTNDGAYTMGGVTQGTYNRWLAKHGKGKADVCQALTREQAKQIFYELFWLPVGADKMPFALALTVVDHYYNTGKVSHLLAQCGQDVVCFNQARIADYKTKSNCNLYCKAWIARVNHLRSLTEGSGS